VVVKKYIVRDMPEALARIRKDLGPDAVIVSSYRVPGPGLKGLFTRRLEVTAALDDLREEKYFGPARELGFRQGVSPGPSRAETRPQAGGPASAGLYGIPRTNRPVPGHGPGTTLRREESGRATWPMLSRGLCATWQHRLTSLQLADELVQMVMEDVASDIDGLLQGPEELFRCWLEHRLAGWCERFCAVERAARVVVVTGPAGTGKTTTLAKLAGRDVMYRNKKVAIVSLSSAPRPGSTEGLRSWARLLGVPFAVAADPEELERLLAGWSGIERFYLDTPSDAFFKAGKLLELAGFLGRLDGAETLLVLSATTRDADLLRAVSHVSRFGCNGLVLTRLDEVSSLGPVFNLLPRLSLPLQYLGIGREIPDDIKPAGGHILASLLLGGAGRDDQSLPELWAAK